MNAAPRLITKYGCKNCTHRVVQNRSMVCTLNPPQAFPIIVIDEQGGAPKPMGWSSSFPPVQPNAKCSHHKFVAAYDEMPTEAPKLVGLGGRSHPGDVGF